MGRPVSKSIPAILGLGAAACVLLSLMMKELVEHESSHRRSPYAPAVESRLGPRLVGAVRIREVDVDGRAQLVVRATVLAGLDKQKLARAIGTEVWLGSQRAGAAPDDVLVRLDDDDGGAIEEFHVPAPRR